MKSESSYKEIAKSTGIFGSSQLINVFLGIIRSKLTAVFLGPIGVGIYGTLQSIIDFNRSISGLGLDSGAVRELATSPKEEVGEKVYIIKTWYLLTAIIGALICLLFSKELSLWAFDSEAYVWHTIALSVVIFFIALNAGITAILQGLRRIPFLAMASSISSIVSLLVLVPVYYFLGMDGIIPMFILSAIITFITTLFFYQKLKISTIKTPTKDVFKKGTKMLELGIFIVIGGIISTGSLLAVRAYIIRVDGLETVGLFHIAWMITILFWVIVLRSANTDFYPKLCSIVEDKDSAKRFVNEQTHFILLIVSPCIIGLIVFAKYVIQILYTSEFMLATSTLQWHLMGAFFKIATTPMASIMLAKNRGGIHLICEIIFWATYLLLGYLLYPSFNIEALGIAYLVAYLVYIPTVLIAGYNLNKASWDCFALKIFVVNTILFVMVYLSSKFISEYYLITGISLLIISILFSWYQLNKIISLDQLISWVKKKFSR